MEIHTVEMHTGGEPLRIVTAGYPVVHGSTLLEKRRYVKNHLDEIRQRLMHEPRGHRDQYGALLVEPDAPGADIGVLFMHNEGYSTMCGHGVIALGKYVADRKLKKIHPDIDKQSSPASINELLVKIQCPCGVVDATVEVKDMKAGATSFVSVPAFAFKLDFQVDTPSFGLVELDIGYGGGFYALVDVKWTKLDLFTTPVWKLAEAADEISEAVRRCVTVVHPEEEDLSFLYGTIFTDGKDAFSEEPTANLTVVAAKEVDRSPTGSGVTARLAVQFAKGLIKLGQKRKFLNSKVHSSFTGEVVGLATCGPYDAVRVKVSGEGFYTGKCVFTYEEGDPLKSGFLID